MSHVAATSATPAPPPPPSGSGGLPPALPNGPTPPSSPPSPGPIRKWLDSLPDNTRHIVAVGAGALLGGVPGFMLFGPVGGIVGAGAGAFMMHSLWGAFHSG